MAIRTRKYDVESKERYKGYPFFFQEMALAHQYCVGEGLEIGAAAHNPFGLLGSKNVAPKSDARDYEYYRSAQAKMCGYYALVDIDAEGDSLPVEEDSQDYVISSHMLEHVPDAIGTLLEWRRVVRPGGVIFIIVPDLAASRTITTDAQPTTLNELLERFHAEMTVEDFDWEGNGLSYRGHCTVFTLELLHEIVEFLNTAFQEPENELDDWEIFTDFVPEPLFEVIAQEESDSKVGNGYTFVLKVLK